MPNTSHTTWLEYCSRELKLATDLLSKRGYTLDPEQPHLSGERFLMQAVTTTSGQKLILFGTSHEGTRVVIKATRDQAGAHEIDHERKCRAFLTKIDFATTVFHTPPELAYFKQAGFTFTINAFIAQPSTFLERPLPQQFHFALTAFKAQEGAHATTFKHRARIRHIYSIREAADYLQSFTDFSHKIQHDIPTHRTVHTLIDDTAYRLSAKLERIEQYGSFLTHTDFVPHNFRITSDGTMYLLDFSSLVFGNKYEGWARFLNFMTLYNPALEQALVAYVRDNRTVEESEALHLMRLYRLGELIRYYASTLEKSDGNLRTLNEARVQFWSDVLAAELQHQTISPETRTTYQTTRDTLRSQDEQKRQQGLH